MMNLIELLHGMSFIRRFAVIGCMGLIAFASGLVSFTTALGLYHNDPGAKILVGAITVIGVLAWLSGK